MYAKPPPSYWHVPSCEAVFHIFQARQHKSPLTFPWFSLSLHNLSREREQGVAVTYNKKRERVYCVKIDVSNVGLQGAASNTEFFCYS